MGALGFLGGFANAVGKSRQAQGDPIDQALKLYQLRQAITEDPLRRALLLKELEKAGQAKLGTPVKVTENGMSGLRYPDGHTEWLGTGENFYEKPKAPSKLYVPNPIVARAMEILHTTDPTVLAQHPEALVQAQKENLEQQKQIGAAYRQPRETPAEAAALAAASEDARLKEQQKYRTPPSPPIRRGADGRLYFIDPRTKKATPIVGMPASPPKADKAPSGYPTGYTRAPSTSIPGAYYLAPNPGAKEAGTGYFGSDVGAATAVPLLYIPSLGKYFRKGDKIGPGMYWDGNP